MKQFKILYRRGPGDAFRRNTLGQLVVNAEDHDEAIFNHLKRIGNVTQPYQWLVQDTHTDETRMYQIPTVVHVQEC
jgi:hypothetical protein